MAIFYIDLVNGSDAADGTSWATAWKTVTNGSTAARIAPGDTIRMAKSPDKISLGDGTWTSVTSNTQPISGIKTITAASNATPISVTVATHGWVTGDVVSIVSVGGNTATNGTWIITNTGTNTFTLDGSVGNGAYTSGGTAQNINFRSVKLASNTQTKLVNDCNITWTAANSSTVSANTTSVVKTPGQGINLTAPAAAVANTKYAFQALPAATDFSAFTHLTLFVQPATAATTANSWRICLCSDTLGATIVDSIPLPALTTLNQTVSLVLPRTGGGALGSSIQSVAIYSGSAATNSSLIAYDNINACTATGLNLQSVISPVSSNTELYNNYPISGIVNNVVLLDQNIAAVNTNSTTLGFRGYSGTDTGSLTTYYRQALDYGGLNSSYATANVFLCTEAGTVGNVTTWSGGWDPATTTQTSLTLVYIPAASRGWAPLNYNKIEWMGILRGTIGYGSATTSLGVKVGYNLENNFVSGALQGYTLTASTATFQVQLPNTITNFGVTNCGGGPFIIANQFVNLKGLKIYNSVIDQGTTNLFSAFNNQCAVGSYTDIEINNSAGVAITNAGGASYSNVSAKLNLGLAYSNYPAATFFNKVTASDNFNLFYSYAASTLSGNNIYVQDITYNEATVVANNDYSLGNVLMSGINGDATNFQGYTYYGIISKETSITHSGTSSWKVNVVSNQRNASYPVSFNFGQIYLKSGVASTISVWVYLQNFQVNANITLKGYQIGGVTTDQVATANQAIEAAWQQLSITVTPTSDGVVTLQANAWLNQGAADKSVYFDDISVPIGINTSTMDQPYFGTPWVQNAVAPSVAYAAVGL